MTEEENKDNDDNYYDYYGNDIKKILLIKEVVSDYFKEKSNLSIIEVGAQGSAGCLISTIINPQISKMIGIDKKPAEESPWRDLLDWKKLDESKTIEYIEGNIFSEVDMKPLKKDKADLCCCHKTLHHLRLNNCKFQVGDICLIENQICKCQECKKAIGPFSPSIVIDTLMKYSNSILISEHYEIGKDEDKYDSNLGGYLNLKELKKMFKYILSEYNIKFYKPFRKEYIKNSNELNSNLNEIMEKIKRVDYIACLIKQ